MQLIGNAPSALLLNIFLSDIKIARWFETILEFLFRDRNLSSNIIFDYFQVTNIIKPLD